MCYLLSLKLDPNSRDERGWTPLHNAAEYDQARNNVFFPEWAHICSTLCELLLSNILSAILLAQKAFLCVIVIFPVLSHAKK